MKILEKRWGKVLLCVLPVLFAGLYHALNISDAVHNTGDPLPMKLYRLLFACALIAAAAAGFFFADDRRRLSRLFFVTGLVLGLLYMAAMPGLSAPDEMSHYITAYRLSDRMLGKPDLTDAGLVAVRSGDFPLEDLNGVKTPEIGDDVEETPEVLGNPVKNSTYRTIRDWDQRYPAGNTMVSSALPDVRTTPVMYLPQAAGMSLARLLKLNAMGLLFFGKFFNLLVFLFLTAAAIDEAPFGKELYFGTAILPMTLHLASSLSYDTGILGTVFLFSAVVLNTAYGTERLTIKRLLLLCILAAAFGPCKMIYAVLVFLFFLIPAEKCGGTGKKLLSFCAVFASLAAAMVLVNASTVLSYASAPAAGSAAAEGAAETVSEISERAGYSVSELIHKPFFILRMVCGTFSLESGSLITGLAGLSLGNLDPLLGTPFWAVCLLLSGLVLMSQRQGTAEQKGADPMPLPGKLWTGLLCAGVILLCAGAMLVSWTRRDAAVIEGIQGRYFLPLLPMMLLLCRTKFLVLTKNIRRELLCGSVIISLYTVLRIFTIACMRI